MAAVPECDALRAIRLFASRIADAVIAGRGVRESSQADTAVTVGPDGEAVAKTAAEPLRAQQRPAAVRPAAPKSEPAAPASV